MKIVIIGGGLMGWYAAMVATSQKHETTLIETDKVSPLSVGESLTFNMAQQCQQYLGIEIEKEINQGIKLLNKFTGWAKHDMVHSIDEVKRMTGSPGRMTGSEFSHIQADYSKDVIKKYVQPKLDHYEVRKVLPNESFDADVVFDCTGLSRLLMREQEFVEYELPCTMATAGRVTPIIYEPWTTTRAMEAGWQWTVTLPNLTGSGYVFSPDFISPEEARQVMRDYWKARGHTWECMVRQIRWTPGRYESSYYGNVFALGLAAGFTEPMEAGAIASGIFAAREILTHSGNFETAHKYQSGILDELAYNTGLHYKLCKREEPFWQSLDKTIDQDVLDWYLNNDDEYGFFSMGSYRLLLESHRRGLND